LIGVQTYGALVVEALKVHCCCFDRLTPILDLLPHHREDADHDEGEVEVA